MISLKHFFTRLANLSPRCRDDARVAQALSLYAFVGAPSFAFCAKGGLVALIFARASSLVSSSCRKRRACHEIS